MTGNSHEIYSNKEPMKNKHEKEEIYKKYRLKVFGKIYSNVENATIAEDLCSDVFTKIYTKLGTFDESKASLSTWIYTITENTLKDYYKTKRIFEELPDVPDCGTNNPEEYIINRMLLYNAFMKLDRRSREIVIAKNYDGIKLKEIAKSKGLSYSMVRLLYENAMKTLRNALNK